MEFGWDNRDLRKICEDETAAQQAYGPELSSKLQARLTEMKIATSVLDLHVGFPSEVPHESLPLYKIDIGENHRLIFCASNVKIPRHDSGLINWSKVNRIKLLQIQEKHEQLT